MTTTVRKFDSGATRDLDINKHDYEAFLSPLVIERYAEYMHKNRHLTDGSLRDGDNWQKGIPFAAYAKSEWRHHVDFWKEHRGIATRDGMEDACCAILFNVMGYLHEYLKAKLDVPKSETQEPHTLAEDLEELATDELPLNNGTAIP